MALWLLGPDPAGDCCACRANPCDSCGPPVACQCALVLPVPNGATPYSNLSDAQTALNDQVSNCVGFIDRLTYVNSFTATASTNQLSLSTSVTYATEPISDYYPRMWASLTLAAGAIVAVSASDNEVAYMYDCNGNLINTVVNNGSFDPIASDGIYIVQIFPQWPSVAGSYSLTTNLTSSNLLVNPVVANWNDGGTIRQLEACPKMLLPALTEVTGNWFVNYTAANNELIDRLKVASCIGYAPFQNFASPYTSFGSTFGGGSFNFNFDGFTSVQTDTSYVWGSINAMSNSTITMSSNFGGVSQVFFTIYDYSANMLFDSHILGTSIISTALPYTGKYIFRARSVALGSQVAMQINITSSDIISVNPIQALYDVGLTCPARLNC